MQCKLLWIWLSVKWKFFTYFGKQVTMWYNNHTPFIANNDRAASMKSVTISLTISMKIPPEESTILERKHKKSKIHSLQRIKKTPNIVLCLFSLKASLTVYTIAKILDYAPCLTYIPFFFCKRLCRDDIPLVGGENLNAWRWKCKFLDSYLSGFTNSSFNWNNTDSQTQSFCCNGISNEMSDLNRKQSVITQHWRT